MPVLPAIGSSGFAPLPPSTCRADPNDDAKGHQIRWLDRKCSGRGTNNNGGKPTSWTGSVLIRPLIALDANAAPRSFRAENASHSP